ncbi:MAG: bifunctional phosphoribosyl-AMP cyclohydrolase/phosphoribosyl-ATP diphosphatase HisIE [Eubacteriales bacterium]
MTQKKLIPCIYLYNGNAVKGFGDSTIIHTDPVKYAKKFEESGADELIIFDFSKRDAEHEQALDLIKEICETIEIPVTGAGNVWRMEDIKKLLYAGCKKAALNYSKDGNVTITEEVSKKFGKEKIVVSIKDPVEIVNFQDIISEYACELLLLEPTTFKEAAKLSPLPVVAVLPEISLVKFIETMKMDAILGISGDMINQNASEFKALKQLLSENGIEMVVEDSVLKWSDFKLNSDGMITVVVQEYKTDQVLMVAYMNQEAYENTIATGKMTYWSRSRNELWVKGETSGHYQYVKELTADCDLDTLLAKVTQVGPACHTGSHSCFFQEIIPNENPETNPLKVFEDVFAVIMDRKENPKEGSYTNYLFDKGVDKILKKLGEEATEIVIAAKNPNPNEIKYEISDFLYHMMVLMAEKDVTWEEITKELAKR